MKTHKRSYKISFSHRVTGYTKKPNVNKITYFSKILQTNFKLFVSTKAMKTIVRFGSFDNYILNTHHTKLRSQYGLYLKGLMRKKLKNPKMDIGYIYLTSWARKNRWQQNSKFKNQSSIFIPMNIRQNEDRSLYFLKDRQDMTRGELQEEKRKSLMEENPEEHEEELEEQDVEFRKQILALQKMRWKSMQEYWTYTENKPLSRKMLLEQMDLSDENTKKILLDDFVPFRDIIKGVTEYEKIEKDLQVKKYDEKAVDEFSRESP